jgi:hypothetical protein
MFLQSCVIWPNIQVVVGAVVAEVDAAAALVVIQMDSVQVVETATVVVVGAMEAPVAMVVATVVVTAEAMAVVTVIEP